MISTLESSSLSCPSFPTSGISTWRLYRFCWAGVLPGAEAALERGDVLVAHLLQRLGRERGPVSAGAVGDDRGLMVGYVLLDPGLEVPARNMDGAGNDALLNLVLLADVDHDRLAGPVARGIQLAD